MKYARYIDGKRLIVISRRETRSLLAWLREPYNSAPYKIVGPDWEIHLPKPTEKPLVIK